MKAELDLLAFCWRLATLFDSVSTNKAFHIWVVMFTYLGLVGAWLYYRRQAHDDELEEANVSDKNKDLVGKCECKDELEQSEVEDDLTDVLLIVNEDICSDDCFEQVPRCEQETQTDRISVDFHVKTSETKEAGCGFISHKSVDPVETTKNTQVNNACDLPSSHEPEYCKKEKIVFDRSQEKEDGSLVAQIDLLKSNDKETQSELNSGLSRKSVHEDNEGWMVYELELEIGLRPSDNFGESIEFNCSEFEEVKEKRTSDVSDGSMRNRKLAKPAQKKVNDENLTKSNPQNTDLLPGYEKDRAFLDGSSLPNIQGKKMKYCEDTEGEAVGHISKDEIESDIEKSVMQIASLNPSDSMCDVVQNNDPPNAYDVDGHVNDVMEDTSGNLSPHETPSGEVLYLNESVLGSLIEAHLESSENMSSSSDNLKLCSSEEKNGRHYEFEHKDSFPVDCDNEQFVNKIAPATSKDNKFFSDVNESFCKQFTHIFNPAEIHDIGDLPNEAESTSYDSGKEVGNSPDRQCELSDGDSTRYDAVRHDTRKKLEFFEDVDLEGEVPSFCNGIYTEGSDINESLHVKYGQGKASTCRNEIIDGCSNISTKPFNVDHDTKELPDAAHPIIDVNSGLLEKNNESNHVTSMHGIETSIENETTNFDHQLSDNVQEMIKIHNELEEKGDNSLEVSGYKASEERILKISYREEIEDAYKYGECKSENCHFQKELSRGCRTDEGCTAKNKVKEISVEENQGKFSNEEVCFATKFYDLETCSSTDNSLYEHNGGLKHQQQNSEILNSPTEKEDMKLDDNINKHLEMDAENTDIFMYTKKDSSQRNFSEKDAFANYSENETVTESAVANDGIVFQCDDLSDKRTDDVSCDFQSEVQNSPCVFDEEFNVSSRNSIVDAQEEVKETFIEVEQSVAFSDEENYFANFDREHNFSEEANFDFDRNVGYAERSCFEKDYESEESTESFKEIDYDLLVSSGTESADVSDDDRFNQWITENESEGICPRTNDNINALATISELEETDIDEKIILKTSANAVDDCFHAFNVRGSERLGWEECLHTESCSQIQLNKRETVLALTDYPKNAGFLYYFRDLLLNHGVFVDVINNVPFQLFCAINNADRIIELSTKKLSSRSHFGFSVANRDPYFARDICEIARDIDYYFSRFIKDCEHRQRRAILPGHFGISYQKKALCYEFEKLSPIVCDPIPTLDVDTVCVDEDNTTSCDVVHPAICCAGCNEYDSNEIFKTNPTQTFDCEGDVNGLDCLTTLAAVHNGNFSESGSGRAGISNYLEGGATALFGLDSLNTEPNYEVFPTDVASQTRQLERVPSIEFHEDAEKNRLCSLVPSNEPVSQSSFHTPLEQEYTLSSSENLHGDRAKNLNFDLLLSKPQLPADSTRDEISAPNFEPQEFETEDITIDRSSTLGMGQVQSVVFTKGTLAMPVSNYSLRGISVRNQGEYAVINKKNTRLAPLVSVDRRIEITMRMPKKNEISPERNTHRISFESKKNNNLPSEKSVESEANRPINAEVLSEFMKHSIVGRECEKKSAEPSIGDKHKSNSKTLNQKAIETAQVDESPTTFSIGYDKIAEIAQNFGIVSETGCAFGSSLSREPLVIAEEQGDVPTSVCTVYIDSKHSVTTENPSAKDIVESGTAKDKHFYHERETTAKYYGIEAPITTVDSSTVKDYDANNEFRIVINPSCFGDFGVTNPSTEKEQIQSVDDNDFQNAVNRHEELSATDNHYEYSLLLADKIFERGQNDLPQKVGFDSFQTKAEIESISTDVEVGKDNEGLIENVGTVDLLSRSKHNRVRSKSLTSLPEGLFENMSWFYRDRPSSVCFDNNTLKASAYGALRKTKSAEISRRKPKIRMSTNFERRPIKETNLDELIKSLEYLGPRKGDSVPDVQQEITDTTSPRGKKIYGKGIVSISKAENETMLISQRKHDECKGKAVSKLVEQFESPSKATRKIIVETKHIIKHEPQQRGTMSANIDKNVKHLYEANKIVGSLDNNNNNNVRLDQRNKTFSIETADKPASFAVCEPKEQRFRTNVKENSTKNFSLEQHHGTKKELHAALNANPKEKENQLVSVQCRSEDRPLSTCSEEWNEITNTKRQLTGNVTENKEDHLHDCNEKVIPITDVNITDKKTELVSLANEKNAQRTSIYGFTVFLSESHQSDSLELTPERGIGVVQSPKQDHYWLQQRSCPDVDGNSNEKVSDIDLVLKTAFQTSCESLEKLNENGSNTAYNSCSNVIESSLNSVTDNYDEGTENLQQFKSRDKPRSRNSFRKDKRLRKWLEDRQSSMNSEEKLVIHNMDADDQSKLLRKIALSRGIDYKDDGEDEIKKKRHFSLRSRQFDFLEQLRYLINFEDDDYDENIKNLQVNEKEHDAIELLREYEINRQLKKGRSPFTSEDEGNDSDAFTDITDTTFSDYIRSRHSLNSLLVSQGSLNRSGSLDLVENDQNRDSLDKEISWKSADIVDVGVSNSPPQKESSFGQSAPLYEERNTEKSSIVEMNVGKDLHVVSTPKLLHEPDTDGSIEKVSAIEFFSTYDVNGLISQGNSAVRNRRGRAAKLNAPRLTLNLGPKAETKTGIEPIRQSTEMNYDEIFIDNPEGNVITKNFVDIHMSQVQTSIKRNKLTESHIYADSPCSLLTERLNDASYENLRVKLVNRPSSSPKVSPTHLRDDIGCKSLYHPSRGGSLRSPIIRTLNNSPQHKRKATSLREMSEDRKTSSLKSRSFHSVPTSPPRRFRELSSRKSNDSYDQHTIGRSLPDLITKPDGVLVSPIRSLNSSGGSSTLSLQQRSPRLHQALPHRHSTQLPFRSPLRSPRFSECEDEIADTETVFSDHTAFFSDSSIDFGYEVDDEDFFMPNSMLDANFSQNVDDFLSHESDGASSGEYFVPLNTRSKRPESRVICCAFGPCKNKDFVDWSQRSQFTSCVSCFTYYCSKECRKAHWNEHKLSCFYGRISYYMKALVRRFETKKDINEKLSRLALEGFRESGRGCVLISFSSPMAAKFFLSSGTNSFVDDPSYATLNEVLNDGIVTKHQVLLQQTLLDYNPEIEFVVNLTVFVGKQNQLQSATRSRFNSSSLLRCSKIPLNGIFLSHELEPYPETSYEIRVFYLPKSKSHHFINETEARRYYCREVSYGLRRYGVVLKRDYPDAYDKLCLYVEHNVEFLPITLYGQSKGTNYKCIVFPEEFSGSSKTLELQGRGMLV